MTKPNEETITRIDVWCKLALHPLAEWSIGRSDADIRRAAAKWNETDLVKRARDEAKMMQKMGYATEIRVNGAPIAD